MNGIDRLEARLRRLPSDGRPLTRAALRCLRRDARTARAALLREMRRDERTLFPALVAKHPHLGPLVGLFRIGHEELRRTLAEIEREMAKARRDAAAWDRVRGEASYLAGLNGAHARAKRKLARRT